MPVHIEAMSSEVTIVDGEMPLSQMQLEKIADFVIARLEAKQRDQEMSREATQLRPMSEPPMAVKGGWVR